MKTCLSLLLGLIGFSTLAVAEVPPIEVSNKVAAAMRLGSCDPVVVIDGYQEDVWNNSYEQAIDSDVSGYYVVQPPPEASDLYGTWRALWDEDHLYLFVTVIDDMLVFAPNNTLELFFSTAFTRNFGEWQNAGYDGLSDAHIIINLETNPPSLVHGLYSYDSWQPFTGIDMVIVPTTTGYNAELSIPWSVLQAHPDQTQVVWEDGVFSGGPSEYTQRDFIGFDIHIQDDDDGGNFDSRLAWCGGPESRHGNFAWTDTSVFGTLQLSQIYPSPIQVSIACSDSAMVQLSGDYYWSEGTGFIYTGYAPFLYFFSAENWVYAFWPFDWKCGEDTTVSHYYIYDFGRSQYGYTGCKYYPNYFVLIVSDPPQWIGLGDPILTF